mmetsp:Transcript_16774/g.46683  ORF Transcript_16774/g.46683 Transcript_16774/m.46683 type:complete len:120 (+) Transcript_16774:228-587(+)
MPTKESQISQSLERRTCKSSLGAANTHALAILEAPIDGFLPSLLQKSVGLGEHLATQEFRDGKWARMRGFENMMLNARDDALPFLLCEPAPQDEDDVTGCVVDCLHDSICERLPSKLCV